MVKVMDKTNSISSYLVIIYQAGDNDLHKDLLKDLNEIEEVGSTDKVTIVSISDQGNYGTQWKGAKVLLLEKDNDPDKVNSKVLENLGQVNMADPSFMAKKISSIVKSFPAENIFLIISDHGQGWQGAVVDTTPVLRTMNLRQIKTALETITKETGRKIDILGWDACLMGMAEIGYELRNFAKYMIASEQTIGADGWHYKRIFSNPLKNIIRAMEQSKDFRIHPENFAKLIVEQASGQESIRTLSAVDLSKAEELAKSIDDLAETILKYPQDFPTIKDLFRQTQKFYMGYRDLGHFLILLTSSNINSEIKEKAQQTFKILQEYVIASYHNSDYPNSYGVSIEMPLNPRPFAYAQTEFAQNTKWDEMYYKVTQSNTPLNEIANKPSETS